MKRICVAGLILNSSFELLLGRRGKDPNRGLYVLPGGGVEDGESLEQAFAREIMEETGLEVFDDPSRWAQTYVTELEDRLILVSKAYSKNPEAFKANSDLYDLGWFDILELPSEISPVVLPILSFWGFSVKT